MDLLLSAEWNKEEDKESSESSSIANSEPSSTDTSEQPDTDFSDSACADPHMRIRDKNGHVLGSAEDLNEDDDEDEEDVGNGRPASVVTDLETCKDFVQDLANQVQAMQEALRKSKDDIDCHDCNVYVNGNASNCESCLRTSCQSTHEGRTVDDGAYETPIGGPPVVLVNGDSHSQSDYEEVSDMSEPNGERSTLSNGVQSENYINISTYERTESLQSLTNNVKDLSVKCSEDNADDGAIYEFPPDTDSEKRESSDETSAAADSLEDEEPKAQYRYDGPLIFDEDDKKDVFKIKEKDKVKKWNPVVLLKTLYEIPQPGEDDDAGEGTPPSGKAGECSMEGYMDKLPMGRRRASLIKKWKRRYFRCKKGNIFYYEDHKTKKSLGYLHLVGGKVTEISNKILEVTDMRGRVLLLRCATKMELEDWKAVLNIETGFYVCQRSSQFNPVTKPVVIVDIGSCSVRAGLLSDCHTPYPQRFFPCAAAINNKNKDSVVYGFDAFTPATRASSRLVFPLRRPVSLEQFKLNTQLVEGLLDTAFTELQIDPRAYTVMLVVPFNLGQRSTEKLVELVFESFHVEGIYIQEQALMSLYSYKATSGIVVNIGEKLDVVPIVDGFVVEKGVCRLPFGGRQITETLTRLLTESGHRYFSETETIISRYLKEKACFVAQDYQAELKFCSLDPQLCSTFLSLEKFNVPDGTGMIKLDYSRFRSTEGLFHPEVWGNDNSGLHTVVYNAIQSCNVDIRRHMCKNIYLCGGTTLLPGLAERLRSELVQLLPKGNSVRVHASPERYHAAYHGACVLAPLSAFDNLCITKAEWKQLGLTSLTKWQGA
ncbi:actin [Holothuria leucospilota]|uniref:Actin n=1 Tax=Holothuria leucospilota TaxID=206669 RepID=A0A9Q1HEQ6_HOLLE|nr:actin [Holothuria leucospilota]